MNDPTHATGSTDRRVCIALDAAGGDHGYEPVLEAAGHLVETADVLLVGPALLAPIVASTLGDSRVEFLESDEVVEMGEDALATAKTKRRSSLHVAAHAVASGRASALVTAGNTGAAVLASALRMRRVPGVIHPALATVLPRPDRRGTVLVDVGATVECKPDWLFQFGAMGAEYARVRLGVERPRIALLSNGHEPGKGGEIRVEAHRLLHRLDGYVGQVEGHDLLTADADVVVTDGFTGNVALKTIEGAIRAAVLLSVRTFASITSEADAKRALESVRSEFSSDMGAVVLGLRGISVICHGAADAGAIASAGRLAAACAEADLAVAIARVVADLDAVQAGDVASVG